MDSERRRPSSSRTRRCLVLFAGVTLFLPHVAVAQGLTGSLIGTVRDAQGGVLSGAVVRVSSPALIGGPATQTTNEKGQLRFPALPPGPYVLDIELQGFTTYHEEDIRIGAGATIERTAVLKLAGLAESVVVEGAGSRIEARDPGFGTRFGPEDLNAIPTRRASMFDFIRAAPGISPTSPASGTATTVSAFGSGTNENQFLIDGTNFTCPCNGVARAEPGIDFIQEIQVQSVGASAEYGNVQGAVINVVTRQGSERFLYDASYYGQTAGLTSQPVRLPLPASGQRTSGYERARYRDFTTNLGGPAIRDRLWFFAGYQYLRDYDSQPGTDPAVPEDLRAGQDLREAHVATGSGLAAGSERSRRVLGQPRTTDVREAIRSDPAPARLGAGHHLRPSDAHARPPTPCGTCVSDGSSTPERTTRARAIGRRRAGSTARRVSPAALRRRSAG